MLPSLGGSFDFAAALNDLGEIVGGSDSEVVMWSSGGSILWHDTLSGNGGIHGLNASGTSCGQDGLNAVIWSPTGVEPVLTSLDNTAQSVALSINAAGQTCGYSGNDAVLWSSTGATTVLAHPGGSSVKAEAVNINSDGDTVGYYDNASNTGFAAYWNSAGKLTNLANILGSGWSDTNATGVDNVGDISGYGMLNGLDELFILVRTVAAPSGYHVEIPSLDAATHPALVLAAHASFAAHPG